MLALPPSGTRGPPPARTLLPGHRSYRLIRRSHSLSSPSALAAFEESLQVCDQPLLLAGPSRRYLCESFPECRGPCHCGPVECTCLFLPLRHRPSRVHCRGRLPALTRQNDFMTDPLFETAAISLCSGPPVCSPPRSFLPLPLIAAGQIFPVDSKRSAIVLRHKPETQRTHCCVLWRITPHPVYVM
jgi:hypothetical protein